MIRVGAGHESPTFLAKPVMTEDSGTPTADNVFFASTPYHVLLTHRLRSGTRNVLILPRRYLWIADQGWSRVVCYNRQRTGQRRKEWILRPWRAILLVVEILRIARGLRGILSPEIKLYTANPTRDVFKWTRRVIGRRANVSLVGYEDGLVNYLPQSASGSVVFGPMPAKSPEGFFRIGARALFLTYPDAVDVPEHVRRGGMTVRAIPPGFNKSSILGQSVSEGLPAPGQIDVLVVSQPFRHADDGWNSNEERIAALIKVLVASGVHRSSIGVKPHPSEDDAEHQKRYGSQVRVLSASIPIELMIPHLRPTVMIGWYSSSLLQALLFEFVDRLYFLYPMLLRDLRRLGKIDFAVRRIAGLDPRVRIVESEADLRDDLAAYQSDPHSRGNRTTV